MTMNMNELVRGGTICLSKAGFAEGTNATTVKTAAPNGAGIDFAINGTMYHLADGDNIAFTATASQAASTTCLYLGTLNSSGTLTMTKGVEVLSADLANGLPDAVLKWPEPPVNECPIAAIKVALAASGTGVPFIGGTTDLGATGVTDTYYDLLAIPSAPRTS